MKKYARLSKAEVTKQLAAVSKLRTQGASVADACKKVGVPVPTYFYRLRNTGTASPAKSLRAKPSVLRQDRASAVDGRTLAALRRSKAKHSTVAETLRKDLLELRRLGRRLIHAAKSLG